MEEQYFLSLPLFWAVTITGVSKASINKVLSDAGESWIAKTDPSTYTKKRGILVAHEVAIPEETSTFDPIQSSQNMGGFLPGYAMMSRTNFLSRTLSVNFVHTDVDIEHNFFRPWMIALGNHGLVEDGANLKATMEVQQFSNKGAFIKGFKFNKVFPTRVEGYTLNQESSDFLIKSVTFGCQNYEPILNPNINIQEYRGDINVPSISPAKSPSPSDNTGGMSTQMMA